MQQKVTIGFFLLSFMFMLKLQAQNNCQSLFPSQGSEGIETPAYLVAHDRNLIALRNPSVEVSDFFYELKTKVFSVSRHLVEGSVLSELDRQLVVNALEVSSLGTDRKRKNVISSLAQSLKKQSIRYLKDVLNNYYQKLTILSESMVNYSITKFKKDSNGRTNESIIEGMQRGEKEALIFEKLGYTRNGAYPNFLELSQNVERFYNENDVPTADRFRLIIRYQYLDANGVVTSIPASPLEAAPLVLGGYADVIAMPHKDFATLMSAGKIPIGGSHDVSHVVGLLSDLSYARAIRKLYQKGINSEKFSFLHRWTYYFFEMYSYPDPQLKEKIRQSLLFKPTDSSHRDIEEYKSFFAQMNYQDLIFQARRLVQVYESFFRFPSGAYSSGTERDEWYNMADLSLSRFRLIVEHIDPAYKHYQAHAADNFIYYARDLRKFLILLDQGEIAKKDVVAVIRNYVARMEYGLWEGLRFNASDIISEVTEGGGPQTEEFYKYLKNFCTERSSIIDLIRKNSKTEIQ